MADIPEVFEQRGPVPGTVKITLLAEEDGAEGSLVTTGATNRSVKRADEADKVIGWAQGGLVNGKYAYINLFQPMLNVGVASGSDAISYGDILENADDGEVQKASSITSTNVIGIALDDAAAGTQVLLTPIQSSPNPLS